MKVEFLPLKISDKIRDRYVSLSRFFLLHSDGIKISETPKEEPLRKKASSSFSLFAFQNYSN
ncbi:hypothetical protein DLM78_17720 [Leptospira stimsonii]|uniref:Uncharacterized protein n=1 Tax=Leptospira stimsonii TaxID=2202203 RepID=A0A8B3CNZ4_9LEPT|nr:hypothetical protein DLM78_17720 [Leptospira stimsonii]